MNLRIKQKGVTLLELLVATFIMAALTVGTNALINTYSEDTKASVIATHISTVAKAGNSYIKDNYSTITSVATPTTPALIRVSDLIAGGYLTTGYSTKNPQLQDTCILVLEPTANNLTALAVTEGGTDIDDLTLGKIAATIGGAGGGIYSTANTTVRGAMGGYSFTVGNFANANHLGIKCDGVTTGNVSLTPGHPMVAMWFDDSNPNSSTLYRDAVPGNPALNTMNTPILMGAGAVQISDAVCTANGALGRDATGGVLSCVSGKWRSAGGSQYWQDPVTDFASLPTCDASALNQTRVVQTPTVGTGARAYTCNGSGTWQPLGVGNDGNITVAGAATIAKLDGNLEVTVVVVEGNACSPNGRIARDSDGLILSCQTGTWKKAMGSSLALGEGQTWQNVLASRALNTPYTNTTGRAIQVMIIPLQNGQNKSATFEFIINGVSMGGNYVWDNNAWASQPVAYSAVIPAGHTYRLNASGTYQLSSWAELR